MFVTEEIALFRSPKYCFEQRKSRRGHSVCQNAGLQQCFLILVFFSGVPDDATAYAIFSGLLLAVN